MYYHYLRHYVLELFHICQQTVAVRTHESYNVNDNGTNSRTTLNCL